MAMRYNDRDVAYFARNARIKPDRTGTLLKRGETNTAYKQRHFVLKGNLLFYFKNANVRPSSPQPCWAQAVAHAYVAPAPGL